MKTQEIHVPDLEGSENVGIVEVYIQAGDRVELESPLISLESDKAVMDVPSPIAGVIKEIKVSEGNVVNTGDLIATAEIEGTASSQEEAVEMKANSDTRKPDSGSPGPGTPVSESRSETKSAQVPSDDSPEVNSPHTDGSKKFHATPSVRSLARELGVKLALVTGSGPKNRITRQDLSEFVKKIIQQGIATSPNLSPFPAPPISTEDFSKYGEVFEEKLSRVKKISGPHIHNNWVGIPHVTQFEESDITEMEEFRKEINAQRVKKGESKISPLIFVIKAVTRALQEFNNFNCSLSTDGTQVIRKKYYNIGIAVDTPGGLLVPVIKNADSMGILELAEEISRLSSLAQNGKLKAAEMQGTSFTISSLGGIGGTYFTPIINAPQSAILGLSKSSIKPVWNGSEFKPRLILPFAVSYDHRVIDGAEGAKFVVYLAGLFSDMRKIIL